MGRKIVRLHMFAGSAALIIQALAIVLTSLIAAWSVDGGHSWDLSPPLPLHGATLSSASFGPAGAAAVVLTGNRAQAITGAGAAWRAMPALPPAPPPWPHNPQAASTR